MSSDEVARLTQLAHAAAAATPDRIADAAQQIRAAVAASCDSWLLIGVLINELRTRIGAWFMRFAIRAVRGERALEFGCEHANSARAGAAIGALIAGIALGVLLGSRSATTLTADYATSQAMVFALRIAMIAGGGGGLLTVYLRRFLCDTSVSVDLAWRRTLVRARLAMRIARRARARRKAPIKAIEGGIK